MSVELPLSASIYPRECVEQAISAYYKVCVVEVTGVTPTGCFIQVNPIEESGLMEGLLVKEFLNSLLDLSVEYYLRDT